MPTRALKELIIGACVVLLLFPSLASAQPQQPAAPTLRISTTQSPQGSVGRAPVQINVTVEADQPVVGARLVVLAPHGFHLDPLGTNQDSAVSNRSDQGAAVTFPLGAFGRRTSRAFMLSISHDELQKASYNLMVDVFARDEPNVPRTNLAHDVVGIAAVPQISVPTYLILGVVGAIIGYLLRLIVRILQTTPGPLPSPAPPQQGSPVGPITAFVRTHYYTVDFLVTLTMVFLAMLALLKDGIPPDNGVTWYGALGIGVGFGLLANSELITRFGR